jgi:hypothetical protein
MYAFVARNWPWLSLLGLAFVVTMPEDLPDGWKDCPRWTWGWVRKGLQIFVSFRTPAPPAEKPKC